MRREADRHRCTSCLRQALFNLRHVPVLGHSITMDPLGHLTVQVGFLGTAASTTHT